MVTELDFGGVEQVLANSIPLLSMQEGVEVSVIVLGNGGRVSGFLKNQNIDIHILHLNPRIPNLQILRMLYKMIKALKPDVLHSQGGEANFHGILAGHWAGVKTIIGEEIGIPNHHSYWKYIFRWVYSKAHVIIAISEAVKDNIVKLGEVDAEKVKVVYNPVSLGYKGVDFSLRTSVPCNGGQENDIGEDLETDAVEMLGKQKNENSFVFITTCRLVPIKNLDRLISAFSELVKEESEKTMELWIVGDGPLKEDLIQQVKSLGHGGQVKFCGFQENVFHFLERADVFVLPSLMEGSSVSLAEAMVCGLPTVITKIGGAPEVLGNSKSGVLVDPIEVDSIKKGMSSLAFLTAIERKEMGERAKRESERFLPEEYISSLREIYKL